MDKLNNPLLGTWHLVRWDITDGVDREPTLPYRDKTTGMIAYTTDGFMSACIAQGGRGMNTALKQANLTVAAEAAWKEGDIDFSSQVAKMKAANVDVILAGTIVRETVGVMAEVKKSAGTT